MALAVAVTLAIAVGMTPASDDPVDDCYARIELGLPAGHSCLVRQTSETGRTDEAIEWLRERLGRLPGDAVGRVTLGRLLARRREPEADAQLVRGIEEAAAEGHAYAEVMGRLTYARRLAGIAAVEAVDAQLEAARVVAERQPDPFLSIEVSIARASIHHVQAARLGHAETLLREVQQTYGEPSSGAQAVRFHSAWAAIALNTGRLQAAVRRYRRAATRAEEIGELRMVARLRYNEAVALRRLHRERGHPGDGRYQGALDAVIDTGLRLDDPELVALARAMLGSTVPRERAVPELERCLDAVPADSPYRIGCLRALAWYRVSDDPLAAEALITEALGLSQHPSQMMELTESLSLRADLLWSRGRSFEAIAEGLAMVEVVETMRGMQGDALSRARVSAAWSMAYYETAGRALVVSGGDLDGATLALSLMERLRARAIRDALANAKAPAPVEPPMPLSAGDAFFADLESRRAQLEARALGGLAALVSEDQATVPAVQARLRPEEAVLSFQLDDRHAFETAPGHDGGGSWVTVITRDAVAVHSLEDGSTLDTMMRTYLGLFMGDPTMLAPAGHALERALLGEALAGLPERVETLIVIPDGRMHRLPLAALARDPEGTPLVQRYAITTVPSAALWLAWRDAGPVPVDRDAYLFADPAARVQDPAGETWGTDLPPLPMARAEVEAIAHHLGTRARVQLGTAATEAHLVDPALDGGLFHLATHAVLDPDNPERSALVLATDETDDGLAYVREIASQPRPDAVVVLAACRGADGLVVRGEGSMDLARGFLQAGARTVVASLWPLSDRQAAPFFTAFYGRLADGRTVADALAQTQREWVEAGRPATTWAGLVVVGDGSARPFSGTSWRPSVERWMALPLSMAGLLALGIGLRRRRHSRA